MNNTEKTAGHWQRISFSEKILSSAIICTAHYVCQRKLRYFEIRRFCTILTRTRWPLKMSSIFCHIDPILILMLLIFWGNIVINLFVIIWKKLLFLRCKIRRLLYVCIFVVDLEKLGKNIFYQIDIYIIREITQNI